MKQRESNKVKHDIELEKRAKEISKRYNGKLSDSVFDDILLRKELDDFTKTRNKGEYRFRFEHVDQ